MRLVVLILWTLTAHAQEDVGLVDLVAGEAAYQAGSVKAYMRVREGDRFELPADAQLGLIYFASGRRERWQGPAKLTAGKRESAPIAGKPAQATTLPAGVPQRLARVPELARAGLFGGVAVRAPKRPPTETEESLTEARATYASMRRQLPADDPTPELFLYSALVSGPDPDTQEAKDLAARLRIR